MESRTYLKNLHVSPKKLRFLVGSVKKMSPIQATQALYYTQKNSAKILYKAIQSAMSNARATLKVQDDLLQFRALIIEEGQRLKRFNAGSRGSAKPFTREFSHIKIILGAKEEPVTEVEPETKKLEPAKTSKKKETEAASTAETSTKAKEEKKVVKSRKPRVVKK